MGSSDLAVLVRPPVGQTLTKPDNMTNSSLFWFLFLVALEPGDSEAMHREQFKKLEVKDLSWDLSLLIKRLRLMEIMGIMEIMEIMVIMVIMEPMHPVKPSIVEVLDREMMV